MKFFLAFHYALSRSSDNLGMVALAAFIAWIGWLIEFNGVILVMSGVGAAFFFGFISSFISKFREYYAGR